MVSFNVAYVRRGVFEARAIVFQEVACICIGRTLGADGRDGRNDGLARGAGDSGLSTRYRPARCLLPYLLWMLWPRLADNTTKRRKTKNHIQMQKQQPKKSTRIMSRAGICWYFLVLLLLLPERKAACTVPLRRISCTGWSRSDVSTGKENRTCFLNGHEKEKKEEASLFICR